MAVPDSLRPIFWDTDYTALDLSMHKQFIITRVAEKGRWSDIVWLRDTYSDTEIAEIVCRSRNTSPKVKAFWQVITSG